MKVIENFKQSKTGIIDDCEDAIKITENFIAVIDGATNKTNQTFQSLSPGKLITNVILNAIEIIPPKLNAFEVLEFINQKITQYYINNNLFSEFSQKPNLRPAASIIMYSKENKQIWSFGDCQYIVNGKFFSKPKLIDKIFSEYRALLIDTIIKAGIEERELISNDFIRASLISQLQKTNIYQNNYLNSDYSYGALDGFKINNKHVHINQVTDNSIIILATDGYPILTESLEHSELKLQNIIKKDPLCYKLFKSTKGISGNNISFDDRAYIKFLA
ncbi:hypothetical protein [Psychroserpens algicola]|uniref:hypothetical protein n=1 Tax=Psychroserpens algicola TaxID=1719034 RepID=UPI001953C291|nr:hypothetical protein [Psychroserpens algicola]